MDIGTLLGADLATLESTYGQPGELVLPVGLFRGHYLRPCASPGARRLANRAMVFGGFELARFGVDFDRRCWWFGVPRMRVGRFWPELGRSRWREAETVRLEYHPSALPTPIRRLLYDEVKPLSAELCLGIGGLNRPAGEGELFFFALERS